MEIDVIIPVYKPDRELLVLLKRLAGQTMPVHKIILMNTEEKYYRELIDKTGEDPAKIFDNVEVHHLAKKDFDHGGTRHKAVQYSQADIFVLMTQDAMPADQYLIEELTVHLRAGLEEERQSRKEQAQKRRGAPGQEETEKHQEGLAQEEAERRQEGSAQEEQERQRVQPKQRVRVAAAYGRQLPGEDSSESEKISRYFNYPEKSRIKTAADLNTMGIKTFFCSNVCAAYRRDLYEESGGFVRHTIFNEDMIYASGAVKAGYGIAYEAKAQVIHSHNYTNMQQLRRNFDLGVSQAEHPEVFAGVPSESEGKRLVKAAFRYLKRKGRLYRFPGFCVQCAFKYAGYKLGKNYKKLPKKWVTALTAGKDYWKQEEVVCVES